MKKQRYRIRLASLLLIALFVVLGIYAVRSFLLYGSRWFSYSANPRLNAQKQHVTEGDILDRNGVMLAYTENGERIFHTDPKVRSALVHLLGDRHGMIANTVETLHAGYLYGYQSSLADAIRHLTSPESEKKGNTITLTVDSALCAAIPGFYENHPLSRGKSGAAAVINYKTGEILALVSLPCFDPDNASDAVIALLDQPYWNRATQWAYAPGSTFKIVTSAAALTKIPDAASRLFTCTGALQVAPDFTVKDFNQASHGSLTLREAFLHSCNCVYASLALEMGDSSLRAAAEEFGFNQDFLFRDLVVEKSVYPSDPQSGAALAASGYGQSGISVTPLHLCLISAAVANDGVMQEPRLLKTVKTFSGVPVLSYSSARVRTVCSPETARLLQSMMRDVVQNGSGTKAAVSTLDVRGKTGTSEVYVENKKKN
ncbi:MAG: hypothetical protein K5922_03020, partial [Clostridiales bacterium]|nr:hypothetical protein [Clostridiales bacterium]